MEMLSDLNEGGAEMVRDSQAGVRPATLLELARACKDRRELMCLTQPELAERAGVSVRTIQSIESGNNVLLSVFLRITHALQLDIRKMFPQDVA